MVRITEEVVGVRTDLQVSKVSSSTTLLFERVEHVCMPHLVARTAVGRVLVSYPVSNASIHAMVYSIPIPVELRHLEVVNHTMRDDSVVYF